MNYRPGIDERPTFHFKGGADSAYGEKIKEAVFNRTEPVVKPSKKEPAM